MPVVQRQPFVQRLPQYVQNSSTTSFPAPTGGWNARDSLDDMDPADAVSLINLFPTFGQVQRRGGYQSYATGLGGAVKTLAEFNAAGTRKFIAAANGKLFDVSSSGPVGAALASGFTSDAWQWVNFQNAAGVNDMVLVNGADAPQIYDGSTVANATISGSGLTVTNLIGATVFKTRVFYWEKASQKLWFSASGAIAGVLAAFNIGALTGFGGNIQAICTWTRDGGSGPDDYCVILLSSGAVLMYSGTDISDATKWALVGIFQIGSPIGTRCFMKLGPDVAIINKDGFVPLSQVMPGLWNPQEALSNKITFAAQQAAALYHDNFGWQPLLYPIGNMAIFNVPISSSVFYQYVLNTATGAWTQFQGMNAVCWCLYNDDPYFGGTDGNVYLFNQSTATGQPISITSDNGGPISFSAQTAWNYLGDRSRLKRVAFVRPIFSSDQSLSVGIAVGSDFNNPNPQVSSSSFSNSGTPWGSPWSSPWSPLITTFLPRIVTTGIANCFSLGLAASVNNAQFNWFSTGYQVEPGSGI